MKARTCLCLVALLGGTSLAAGIGGGSVPGPDESLIIDIILANDPAATADVVSILLDGGTAAAFPILWDSAGTAVGPEGADVSFSGVDTRLLTISFLDGGDGFEPGESITLLGMDPDGDPGPTSVSVADLAGVQALFNFEDGSSWSGVFVDDPAPGAGLVLVTRVVPIPAPGALLLGAAGVGLSSRLRRHRAV